MHGRKVRGFTLIELMIAVAIVGILSAIAYPSFVEQLRQSRRADCASALVSLANAMERHYTVNGTYLGAATGGADTGAPAIFATSSPVDGGEAYYNLTIQNATASTFTVQATPTGAQASDQCGSFTLTNNGRKGLTGAAAGLGWEDCWR